MRNIRSKGMKPEMAVRRLVHSLGYRYRLHAKELPGKPDLVFRRRRKVVFVHGCFWHQHSATTCKISHKPKSNTGYWNSKLARNVTRDNGHLERLKKTGWSVLIVWECEIADTEALSGRIKDFLSN